MNLLSLMHRGISERKLDGLSSLFQKPPYLFSHICDFPGFMPQLVDFYSFGPERGALP